MTTPISPGDQVPANTGAIPLLITGQAPPCGEGNREEISNDDGRDGKASASSMDRYAYCAGSANACRGLPELRKQKVTAEGTRIHDALHTGDDDDLELTEKEIADKLRNIEQSALTQWMEEFDLGGKGTVVFRETRFWIRNRTTLEPIASAKPDVVFLCGSHALGINFKSGYAESTPSEVSWQCRTEAIAFWHEHPEVEHARWGIAASRLSSKLDTTDYSAVELQRVNREIEHVVWRSEQPDAPRVPGAHCRWCRAQTACREAATYSLIASHGMPVALADGTPNELAIIDRVGRMTPQELAFVHEREAIARVVFDSVETRMKTLPKEVLEPLGYMVAPGNENKEIVDVPKAFARLSTLLTDIERVQCIKITRGKAAKLLTDRTKVSKKKAGELIDSAIGDAMVDKTGQSRLKKL